jgi:hypothetical protein
MRDLYLISLLTIILTACDNRQADKEISLVNKDKSTVDSSLIKTNKVFKNPFRDINNFDIAVNNNLADSLLKNLLHDPQSKTKTRLDICAGDNCTSLKTVSNSTTTLHFFKSDGGEYGFSNDQFILTKDSVSFVRNFSVGIETWPTDSTETVWACTEKIFYFYKKYVKVLEKKALTNNLYNFDFSLKDVSFEIQSLYGTNLYKDKWEELNFLLTMQSED